MKVFQGLDTDLHAWGYHLESLGEKLTQGSFGRLTIGLGLRRFLVAFDSLLHVLELICFTCQPING